MTLSNDVDSLMSCFHCSFHQTFTNQTCTIAEKQCIVAEAMLRNMQALRHRQRTTLQLLDLCLAS